METNDHILIAIDETEASLQAVRYVSRMVSKREDTAIYLFHVLPPIPPKFLESGGTEDPVKEQRLSTELKKAQSEWIAQAKVAASEPLEIAQKILTDDGLSPAQISPLFSSSIHRPNVVREVVEAAAKHQCSTIVVGRNRLPSVQELFYRHTGEELVEVARDFCVWVVAC